MAVTRTKGERRQAGESTGEGGLGQLASTWPAAVEDEAQTRSDLRLLPDDEERLLWTTRTLVELEGDSDRLDFAPSTPL